MIKNRRWMKSMIAEAKKTDTQMPWARGAKRQSFKAGVSARLVPQKLAASA